MEEKYYESGVIRKHIGMMFKNLIRQKKLARK
jgi:hypothetical protein